MNTEDGSVAYDVTFALVWADGGHRAEPQRGLRLASCRDCRTVAVAFQVVLLVGLGRRRRAAEPLGRGQLRLRRVRDVRAGHPARRQPGGPLDDGTGGARRDLGGAAGVRRADRGRAAGGAAGPADRVEARSSTSSAGGDRPAAPPRTRRRPPATARPAPSGTTPRRRPTGAATTDPATEGTTTSAPTSAEPTTEAPTTAAATRPRRRVEPVGLTGPSSVGGPRGEYGIRPLSGGCVRAAAAGAAHTATCSALLQRPPRRATGGIELVSRMLVSTAARRTRLRLEELLDELREERGALGCRWPRSACCSSSTSRSPRGWREAGPGQAQRAPAVPVAAQRPGRVRVHRHAVLAKRAGFETLRAIAAVDGRLTPRSSTVIAQADKQHDWLADARRDSRPRCSAATRAAAAARG